MGTHVLLEAAKKWSSQIHSFIHMSCDDILPTSLHAASKIAAEYLVKSYAASFSLPIILIRTPTVFGPGQASATLVATLIQQFSDRRPCTLVAKGQHRCLFSFFPRITETWMVKQAFICLYRRCYQWFGVYTEKR